MTVEREIPLALEKSRASSSIAVHALFACLLLAPVPFSSFYFSGWCSFAAFLVYAVYIFASNMYAFFKYFIFWITAALNILGVVVCEYTTLYLGELQCWSGFAGSLPSLILFWWVFLAVLNLFEARVGHRFSIDQNGVSKGMLSAINGLAAITLVFSLGVFALAAASAAPAMVLGVDRFAYADLTAVPGSVTAYLLYLMPFSVLAIRFGNRPIGVAGVLFYVAYLFWIGTKFGGYENIIAVFVMVYCDLFAAFDFKAVRTKARKYALAIIVACAALVGFAVFFQTTVSGGGPLEYLESRLAAQGQLWWKTYSIYESCDPGRDFSVELSGLTASSVIADNVGSRYGIYGIMYLTTPGTVVNAKLLSGSRYTMAGFAAVYSYFGLIGCILFALVMSVLVRAIINGVMHPLDTWQVVAIPVCMRLFSIVRGSLSMFTFADLLDPVSLCSYAVLFLVFLVRQNGKGGEGLRRDVSADVKGMPASLGVAGGAQ